MLIFHRRRPHARMPMWGGIGVISDISAEL